MSALTEHSPASLVPVLEARARAANNLAELHFSMVNDSYALLPFQQALLIAGAGSDGRVGSVSGLAKLSEDSPYLVWLNRVWPELAAGFNEQPAWRQVQNLEQASADLREGWQEWWPEGLYGVPLTRRDGGLLGWLVFLLEQPPTQLQHQGLLQLAQSWSYCWEMLAGKPRRGLRKRWQALSRRQRYAILLCCVLAPLLPVRQSLLAPAEVVALQASVVAAPMEGVIKALHVRPNQSVSAGELLFSLDDTSLRSRQAVLVQSVAVADAELMASTQKAFDDPRSKGELNLLSGRAQERRAELAQVQAQLQRVEVRAERAGVLVFSDPDDWLGRPVRTGERIMQLAEPASAGVLIEVPVADAVTLQAGAAVKLFLTVQPLSPLDATVIESSYQAQLSAEGIASYRLRARFSQSSELARIGLRGTAKVYGDWTVLGYYLLRRPLASARELTGW